MIELMPHGKKAFRYDEAGSRRTPQASDARMAFSVGKMVTPAFNTTKIQNTPIPQKPSHAIWRLGQIQTQLRTSSSAGGRTAQLPNFISYLAHLAQPAAAHPRAQETDI